MTNVSSRTIAKGLVCTCTKLVTFILIVGKINAS